MKTAKLSLLIAGALFSVASVSAQASSVKTVNSQSTYSNTVSNIADSLSINDVNISLTKEDLVKAKNFDLSNQEYAKYKYIMEYTPRGKWTPDIDPVIALGNTAKTEEERTKYAKLAYKQRTERERLETAFAMTMIKVEQQNDPNSPRWMNWEQKKEFALKDTPVMANASGYANTETVDVFLDPTLCVNDARCLVRMTSTLQAKQPQTMLKYHLYNATDESTKKFKATLASKYRSKLAGVSFVDQGSKQPAKALPYMTVNSQGKNKTISLI
ncbi:hypothetical protein [Photobacterium leiognathi]|uniref:hypothetical protein n=1 Tax=Photobacterium leiognathi TaxID=553611 RepID=UPI0029813322|nr:hypothetical protein [Photobacterium leiognathi]